MADILSHLLYTYCCSLILCLGFSKLQSPLTNEAIRVKRNHLFGQEKARQMGLTTCIEKIEVKYVGPPENCTLLMNKDLSTPFNCAMRKLCLIQLHFA